MLMWLSMRAPLDARSPAGFSKTARSRPCHPEAGGDSVGVGTAAVLRRGSADYLPECPAEGAEAHEAHVEADLSDAAIGFAQHEHRSLHAAALKVAVRCLAKRRAERAYDVRLRYVRDPRQRSDVERAPVVAVHRVARAEHPAVGVLDGGAHRLVV